MSPLILSYNFCFNFEGDSPTHYFPNQKRKKYYAKD